MLMKFNPLINFEIIRDVAVKDKDYVDRLKRHYDMFKLQC